jgi:copper transport protein
MTPSRGRAAHEARFPTNGTGSRARSDRLRLFVALALLGIVLLALMPGVAGAHAELVRSEPGQGAALGSAPARIDLWFSETLSPNGSSIRVYDSQRKQVDKGDDKLDPSDAKHVSVSLNPLSDGTYTVAWTSASVTDGHIISGTYSFTVGVSRLPGAAASTNQTPSPAAIALRWIVFAGLAICAGWFLLRLLGVELAATRRELIFGGALAALIGDLLLVPVQAYLPGGGLPAQSLANTYSTMPDAWFARLALEVVLLALVLAVYVAHRKGIWLAYAGALASGAAIIGLAWTTHAAARSSYHIPALLIEIVHVESVAFWLGGLGLLALLPAEVRAGAKDALHRFSRTAVILAPLAIASGILNAGFTLPSVASLWQSSYGKILLLKIVFVVGIGVFAWLNRRAVRAGLALATRFVRSMRVEMSFGMAAILVASVLSLWAPPQASKIVPLQLSMQISDNQTAHVTLTPASDGANHVEAWLTDKQGQPASGISNVIAGLSMLERPIDLPDTPLKPSGANRWEASNVPLTVQGWWRLTLIFFKGATTPANADFYFMIPDPTLVGGLNHRDSDAQAQTIFNTALTTMDTMTSMRADQTLADGVGNSVESQYQYAAPDKFAYQTSSGASSVAIGKTQWYRQGNDPWEANQRADVFEVPHTLTTFYNGASEFTLGRTETIDNEVCQIITFSVPAQPGQGAAWYAWWVGTQTHLLRREAMVANHHYMINRNSAFNTPITIEAPSEVKP